MTDETRKETAMTDEIKIHQERALADLRDRLNEIKFEDDVDLEFYIQYAGRLASLGDKSGIERLPEILNLPMYKGRFNEILTERANRGVWDCNEQLGEELGHSIIEAQDYYCFFRHYDLLPTFIMARILEWVDVAMKQELDEDAVELLEQYLLTYPLDDDDQIAPVAAPMTSEQKAIIERILQPRVLNYTAETVDGVWTCKIKRGGKTVVFTKRLDGKKLIVTTSDNCPHITLMRIGAMPMQETEKGVWKNLIPMEHFEQENIDQLATQELVVISTGCKLKMK